jgi:heme oxygenase (mycobilin-producing)
MTEVVSVTAATIAGKQALAKPIRRGRVRVAASPLLTRPPNIRAVTIIKINAITVPAEHGEEIANRFASRIGAVDNQDGFEGFELLRPTDDRTTWLVVSRWRDEDAFQAWVQSPSFAAGHRGVEGAGSAGGHPGGHPGGGHGGGHPGGEHGGGERPLAMNAELWSYDIATAAEPKKG